MNQETQHQAQKKSRRRKLWEWTKFSEKGLWDWLELLVILTVLAVGGLLFSQAQDERQRAAEEQRAQETALQDYISGMGSLLLDEGLYTSGQGDEVQMVARARTVTVLNRLAKGQDPGLGQNEDPQQLQEQLDPRQRESYDLSLVKRTAFEETDRRGSVLQFLKEAGLIEKEEPLVSVAGANLRGAFLMGAALGDTDLREAKFLGAEMPGATLNDANLNGADLSGVNLSGVNLSYADLSGADLSEADLGLADLSFANLEGANRTEAEVSDEQLSFATIQGATMPDGSKR